MRIKYESVTGEVIEIEVSEYFGELSVAIDKDIYNSDRRETRRHASLNALEEAGIQLADSTAEVAAAVEGLEQNERLNSAINQLLPRQKELIRKVYFDEVSLVEIAKKENVTEAAIRNRLKKIYKKLEKVLG
jgi:RNA polymerase sigma factor (sigma-70 family)